MFLSRAQRAYWPSGRRASMIPRRCPRRNASSTLTGWPKNTAQSLTSSLSWYERPLFRRRAATKFQASGHWDRVWIYVARSPRQSDGQTYSRRWAAGRRKRARCGTSEAVTRRRLVWGARMDWEFPVGSLRSASGDEKNNRQTETDRKRGHSDSPEQAGDRLGIKRGRVEPRW
jgi:hypothetical protein